MSFSRKFSAKSPFKLDQYKMSKMTPKQFERAKKRVQKVKDKNRKVDQEGTWQNKMFGGKMVDGEYRPGLADSRLMGGAGTKNLRRSGINIEGDFDKRQRENKRRNKKMERRGITGYDQFGVGVSERFKH
tara:strand:+ start:639 stop:1028 length:390 start_codon:yes stop_codon:yes gene_type:complete